MFRSYDWFPLGTHIFYRRIDLFPGVWPEQHIDLTRYDVAAGHFGGCFGMSFHAFTVSRLTLFRNSFFREKDPVESFR